MLLILSFGLKIINTSKVIQKSNVLREIMYILMENRTKFKGYN